MLPEPVPGGLRLAARRRPRALSARRGEHLHPPARFPKQITLFGSWVTSLKHMEELLERLDRWGIHPERICTHRLPLSEAGKAYELVAGRQAGKVCI